MSEVTVEQALQFAIEHQKYNQLDEAEEIYKQILSVYPDQSDALYLYGMLAVQRGRYPNAALLLERAVASTPNEPTYRLSLGYVYQNLQRLDESITEYRTAVQLKPDFADARSHLGVVLSLAARYEEAVDEFQEALRISPTHASAQGNLGLALCHLQRYDEAIWVLRAAVTQAPKVADYHASLGAALFYASQMEAAAASCKKALELDPNHGSALHTLSMALQEMGQAAEALEYGKRAAEILPEIIDAQLNVGESLRRLGKLDECIAFYQNALLQKPNAAELYNNLGNVLKDQALLDQALDTFRHGLTLRPDSHVIHSNILYTMQYHPSIDQDTLFAEHQKYNTTRCVPLAALSAPHINDRSPNRKLKVAYISSEFRAHALGLYMLPLLSNHDKNYFEIYCYSDVPRQDGISYRIKQFANHWINIRGLTDKEVADKIRNDQIDILIDLHMHMGGGRTLVYAQKPAPVQIAFAGYPGTTGLTMTDFRLTDAHLEPENLPPVPSSEKVLRLPDTFWCYFAQAADSPVNPLPALTNNFITFASLNNFCKVNMPTLTLWAKVMNQLPNSRLMLLTDTGSHRTHTTNFFADRGIDASRISFVPRQKPAGYFQTYHQIDIGLDTFPYNGHTTSLDSFFMGVPVVTLIGHTPVSRAGFSQLTNLNLTELAAPTEESFIQTAVGLANDLPRLSHLRATLRDRMKGSPLMNGPLFAKNIEAAYRTAWNHWCNQPK